MNDIYGVLNGWDDSCESLQSDITQKKKQTDTEIELLDRRAPTTVTGIVSSINWYRIMSYDTKGSISNCLFFISRQYMNKPPEALLISASLGYQSYSFDIIKHFYDSNNMSYKIIDKIRIVYYNGGNETGRFPAYIDIHYNSDKGNEISIKTIENGLHGSIKFHNLPVAEEIPENYISYEFDLTQKDIFERVAALENK